MKIYLSSTFADLEHHRERVYRELRSLRHDVVAMEDYVAADKRPVEQCLQDVRAADTYVGMSMTISAGDREFVSRLYPYE